MDEFKHIHFENPKKFLEFFEPENSIWFNDTSRWIFRGQAQSNWGLNTTLARDIINDKYTDNTLSQFYWSEMAILNGFIFRCREIGLELPISQKGHPDSSFLDFDERLHTLALGQHYGLPTRMLDWTRNRWNALFFALDTLNNLEYSRTSNLSVWCLNTQYTELGLPLSIEGVNYTLNEFHPSFHKNINAVSQVAMFTYLETKYDKNNDKLAACSKFKTTNINHFDLDYILKNGEINLNHKKEAYTIGYKLTVSRKHYNFLKSWLSNRLIKHYNLFPDYKGVVSSTTHYWKESLRQDGLSAYKNNKRKKFTTTQTKK